LTPNLGCLYEGLSGFLTVNLMEIKGPKIELIGENDYRIIFNHEALSNIDLELSKIPEDERAGVARSFLAASALYCMVSSVNTALRVRGVDVNHISASSSIETGKLKGRSYVEGLDLDIQVDVPDESRAVLDHSIRILEDGCLVTRSLERGINVNHIFS
jgi:uncharacterized OsmC-like protein